MMWILKQKRTMVLDGKRRKDDKDEEKDGWPWTDDGEDIVSEVLVFASCVFLNVSPDTKNMLRHGLEIIVIYRNTERDPR